MISHDILDALVELADTLGELGHVVSIDGALGPPELLQLSQGVLLPRAQLLASVASQPGIPLVGHGDVDGDLRAVLLGRAEADLAA